MLVLAIRRQEEGGLAREVLEEQLAIGFPRLGREVSSICREIGLPDACRMDVSKEEVKEAIRLRARRPCQRDGGLRQESGPCQRAAGL